MYLATLTFYVKKSLLKEFLSWYGTSVKTTKRFSGCLDVEVHVEQSSENSMAVTVLALQTWSDADSHKKYLSYREITGFKSTYTKFLAGKTELKVFDRVIFPNDETECYKI